jgi:hypothetical protein
MRSFTLSSTTIPAPQRHYPTTTLSELLSDIVTRLVQASLQGDHTRPVAYVKGRIATKPLV